MHIYKPSPLTKIKNNGGISQRTNGLSSASYINKPKVTNHSMISLSNKVVYEVDYAVKQYKITPRTFIRPSTTFGLRNPQQYVSTPPSFIRYLFGK
jgi:hypothetical protein